jgi:putative Ca2+/H+ antiporter (TMEM165/GDT1 family)
LPIGMARAVFGHGETIDRAAPHAPGALRGQCVCAGPGNHVESFLVSTGLVALAELGDKTQIATVLLAARYTAFARVVAGTTLGMMLANVPAVLLGERLAERAPLLLMQRVAAVICAALGVLALVAG